MQDGPIDTKMWHKRIQASRRRRDKRVDDWAGYAILHARSYSVEKGANDDESVHLPNGDQIRLSLVYRNVEQTMGILEMPNVGIRATASDFTRELGPMDTHAEQVVELGVLRSMSRSGLIKHKEEVDPVKRDGIVIGHGITYTGYRTVTEPMENLVPVFQEGDGVLIPVLDENTGEQLLEPEMTDQVIWENCYDKHVSPIQFLFSSSAKTIPSSPWHGFEDVVSLEVLRSDPFYKEKLPNDLKGMAFRIPDLYGDVEDDELLIEDTVRIIKIYNKLTRELMEFLETTPPNLSGEKAKRYSINDIPDSELMLLDVQKIGVAFDSPIDDSPFNFFIPIPANDKWDGISQVEHIRNPAGEADKTRTRAANWVRELRRIPWFNKRFESLEEALSVAYNSGRTTPIGLDIDDDTPPEKLFGEIPTPNIHPEIFQGEARAKEDVREISGIAERPSKGADTATEAEVMNQVDGARPNRKKRLYLKFLTDVARTHKAFLARFAPEGKMVQLIGLDGVPVMYPYGRAAFQPEFELEVTATGGTTSLTPIKQKLFTDAMPIMLDRFGPRVNLHLLREFMTTMDMRNINPVLAMAREDMGVIPAMPSQAIPGQIPQTNLNDITNGQALRSAANVVVEG
ncbi:MAG: hypothetical protein OEZ43_20990 [Gammaproteobacteria bacterium]|nr:hypothetical protein [Gammaproteobacteria bacterium]